MNWDWEKLQEKRHKQPRRPKPRDIDPESPFPEFNPGDFFSKFKNSRISIGSVLLVLLIGWLLSGIFIVKPGERGVITRFGQYNREVGDGPHYHLPFPLETAEIVVAEPLRTVVIGQMLEGGRSLKGVAGKSSTEESSMFTGDENIVHMRFNVQYNISGSRDFLFSVRDPETTIKIAAEAAMREVVGRSKIDSILTAGRSEIQVEARHVLENILAPYQMGVRIHTVQLLDVQPPPEVEAAFKDVASAREDRVRIINEAEAYRMKIVPVANGTAQGMINAAQAYSRQVEQAAEGEAQRFLSMVNEYSKAKDITRKRMYLDAMGEVLSSAGLEKIIVSRDAQGRVLPILSLDPKNPLFGKNPQAAGEGAGR
ncbi:MAG: FtsH protease activity modulator HflK [Desulfovibrio sp.]|jgi:membrane protease subunit HflK|nr:FtsH protease activity modulator HflK [Desulfovibrio sp.]